MIRGRVLSYFSARGNTATADAVPLGAPLPQAGRRQQPRPAPIFPCPLSRGAGGNTVRSGRAVCSENNELSGQRATVVPAWCQHGATAGRTTHAIPGKDANGPLSVSPLRIQLWEPKENANAAQTLVHAGVSPASPAVSLGKRAGPPGRRARCRVAFCHR